MSNKRMRAIEEAQRKHDKALSEINEKCARLRFDLEIQANKELYQAVKKIDDDYEKAGGVLKTRKEWERWAMKANERCSSPKAVCKQSRRLRHSS